MKMLTPPPRFLAHAIFFAGVFLMGNLMAQGQLTSPWTAKDPDTVHTDRRVGIGTSNPLMPLHVVGDAWVGNRLFARELHAQDSMSIGTLRFSNAGDSDSILTAAGRALVISAGLTRIGTGPFSLPVPTGLALDIAGDVRAQGANFEVLKIGSSIRMGENDPNTNNDHTIFSDADDLLINTHAASNGFHTILNAGANTNNVGIGVLNPSEKLHVGGGNVRFDNLGGTGTVLVEAGNDGVLSAKGYSNDVSDVLRGDGTWGPSPLAGNAWELTGNAGTNPSSHFIGTTDAQGLSFRTNDAERMRITQDGMVGIGRDNPLAPLHVNGRALISHRTGIGVNNPQKMLHVKTKHVQVVGGGGGGPLDHAATLLDEILNAFDDAAGMVDGAVVDSNGNVMAMVDTASGEIRNTGDTLIGVISGSPADQAHSSHHGLRLEDEYFFDDMVLISTWDIKPGYAAGPELYIGTPNDTFITVNGSNFMGKGNVGIGTTNPTQRLHVNGVSQFDGVVRLFNSSVNKMSIRAADDNSSFLLRTGAFGGLSNVMQIRGGGSETPDAIVISMFNLPERAFVLRGNGNVGIGTTNPQYKLDVAGNTHVSGKLGVGTTDIPSDFELAVNGDVIAENFWADLKVDWPDYVFHEAYQPMNFLEKERWYRKHKSLPYMPSAAEVNKEGLDVSNTMVGLTKNVEENRLDITALYHQVEAMKKEMEALKKENAALKQALEDKQSR